MEENKNDKIYRNLVLLLKMFKNRPHHLAKFLLDNNSFNKRFLDKILTSNKLNELEQDELDKLAEELDTQMFFDISHVNEYYQSAIVNDKNQKQSSEQIEKELNYKLTKAIEEERYEDAARIRDYMTKHNIKKF
jgi:excinuclease UvrABC helicase subunit UvrB